jgi:hypothetical protein
LGTTTSRGLSSHFLFGMPITAASNTCQTSTPCGLERCTSHYMQTLVPFPGTGGCKALQKFKSCHTSLTLCSPLGVTQQCFPARWRISIRLQI